MKKNRNEHLRNYKELFLKQKFSNFLIYYLTNQLQQLLYINLSLKNRKFVFLIIDFFILTLLFLYLFYYLYKGQIKNQNIITNLFYTTNIRRKNQALRNSMQFNKNIRSLMEYPCKSFSFFHQ